MENGADLHIIGTFLSPAYERKQKDVLFRMLFNAPRTIVDGFSVSINRLEVNGYVGNLATGCKPTIFSFNSTAAGSPSKPAELSIKI